MAVKMEYNFDRIDFYAVAVTNIVAQPVMLTVGWSIDSFFPYK